MKQAEIVAVIGIVLLIIVAWCILQMIKSYMQLKRLQTHNPIVDNKVVRDFVYTKPEVITQGSIFDIVGIVNIVDAPRGTYELLVRQNYGGGKNMHQRLASYEGTVMMLQQPFHARYLKEVNRQETNYYVFQLKRLEGIISPLLKDIEPNTERRMHLLVI